MMQKFRLKNIIRNYRHCVTNKTKFVVASEGGGMFMFSNITIKVQKIKIGEKMNMGKTMIRDLAKLISILLFIYPSVN